MREIKFRAWDIDIKRMFFMERGDFHIGGRGANTFTNEWIEEIIKGGFVKDGFHQPKILMQYTGLKDKNGKEIYEGDILKVTDENDEMHWEESFTKKKNIICDCGIADVEFYEGMWYLNGQVNNALYDLKENAFKFEIIGNIYQNPELLEKT